MIYKPCEVLGIKGAKQEVSLFSYIHSQICINLYKSFFFNHLYKSFKPIKIEFQLSNNGKNIKTEQSPAAS